MTDSQQVQPADDQVAEHDNTGEQGYPTDLPDGDDVDSAAVDEPEDGYSEQARVDAEPDHGANVEPATGDPATRQEDGYSEQARVDAEPDHDANAEPAAGQAGQ